MTVNEEIVAALLTLCGVVIGSVLTFIWQTRKTNADREAARRRATNEIKEHEDSISLQTQSLMVEQFEAMVTANKLLHEELTAVRSELRQTRAENRESQKQVQTLSDKVDLLTRHVEALEAVIRDHDMTPPPRPGG